MFGIDLVLLKPLYLLLLLLLPVVWVAGYRSMGGLGRWRWLSANLLRTLVLVAFVLALAEVQLRRTSEKLTVIYVLDQSQSIPIATRQAMLDYVVADVKEHRNAQRADRAGLIIFAAEAAIESPPFDADLPVIGRLESLPLLRTDATNLAAALKMAQASFPEDTAKRIVVVTDGNENVGDARGVAASMAADGVAIDVVPVAVNRQSDVAVEKVSLPADLRQGQPSEVRVVLHNYKEPTADDPAAEVDGMLRVTRQVGAHVELLAEKRVRLAPGKNVFAFEQKIKQPGVFTYEARFSADDPRDDDVVQNNEASAYTHVRGRGRVLLIEDWQRRGDFDYLVNRLRSLNVEVDVQATDQLFSSLAELQGYDCVILANAARSSGDENSPDSDRVYNFSDDQIGMLVRNTEQFGSGLVMLGGDRSFGAGGWTNTELEKAMPVDFEIRNERIEAVGALVLMMHASELAQGNYWQKVVAREAIKTLNPTDYCGLIYWSDFASGDSWLWGGNQGLIRVGDQRNVMLARLDRMAPGDMPQFGPAMRKALVAFGNVRASVKHMIIISDGDPTPPSPATIAAYQRAGIKVTTVAVGTHGPPGSTPLQDIATKTQGKYYVVTNARALPRIYQREARRVSRPLIFEPEGGVNVDVVYPHDIVQGIERGSLPPVKAYVLTTRKENPLVETLIVGDKPDAGGPNSTILAAWTYGMGRTAVLTTDAGKSWADAWTQSPDYDKFFGQLVRWAMRPVSDQNKFAVATDVKDGKVRVVITALDKDDEFLNFLHMSATAVGPDLEPLPLRIEQVAPGRYVGEFPAASSGSYFVTVHPGGDNSPLLAGVDVPYSAEFRDRQTNVALLESLASLTPEGGQPGAMIAAPLTEASMTDADDVDTYRHNLPKATSSQGIWPFVMLLAAVLFFHDVLVRRVAIGFAWVAVAAAWARDRVLRRERPAEADVRIERLRQSKAAISGQIDQRRAAARFEPQPDAPPVDVEQVLSEPGVTAARPATPRPSIAQPPGAAPETSYTERLLEAKRKAALKSKKDRPN